jgi:hypothetical protein
MNVSLSDIERRKKTKEFNKQIRQDGKDKPKNWQIDMD